jgi:epoxyqueuosine reductase
MDWQGRAQALGFDDLGIADATTPVPYAAEFLAAQKAGRFGPLDYLHQTAQARADLLSVFPEAKSVVVVVKNYYTGDHPHTDEKQPKIARYAWGQDYHQWFKKRLKKLSAAITEVEPTAKVWIFNDTGPFLERAWAVKAGLGFLGKSAMFIHRHFGTWTLLGGFATDLALPPSTPYQGPDCGSCTRCLDACPTNAIVAPHTLDARRCISTWTIERTLHPMSTSEAPRQQEWGFGCDVCQEVCPWNKFEVVTGEERFQPVPGRIFLDSDTLNQDLNGSALNRTRRAGLLVNYLRAKGSLVGLNPKER